MHVITEKNIIKRIGNKQVKYQLQSFHDDDNDDYSSDEDN